MIACSADLGDNDMQRLTGAIVAALVLITPALAEAQETLQQEVVVNFGDLDVSTDRDAARALHRIRRAAEDVCDASTGRRTHEDRVATRACMRDAMGRAVDDLGSAAVTARFSGDRVFAGGGVRS
jgi:UrcA family protein